MLKCSCLIFDWKSKDVSRIIIINITEQSPDATVVEARDVHGAHGKVGVALDFNSSVQHDLEAPGLTKCRDVFPSDREFRPGAVHRAVAALLDGDHVRLIGYCDGRELTGDVGSRHGEIPVEGIAGQQVVAVAREREVLAVEAEDVLALDDECEDWKGLRPLNNVSTF